MLGGSNFYANQRLVTFCFVEIVAESRCMTTRMHGGYVRVIKLRNHTNGSLFKLNKNVFAITHLCVCSRLNGRLLLITAKITHRSEAYLLGTCAPRVETQITAISAEWLIYSKKKKEPTVEGTYSTFQASPSLSSDASTHRIR